jgi:threonine aldolase
MYKRGFASDNNSGIHPEILKAIGKANSGHTTGYGGDIYTEQATEKFRDLFGNDADVYFCFNGTGANVLSISTLARSFHSVLCPATAHINVDECGAPEKISGSKIISIETTDGKLTPELVKPHLHGFGFEHHSQPGILSISQATEMGTVYKPDELMALTKLAHGHNMYVHMDGARIANAAVSLNLSFREITRDVGIDALSFGGTKNGMMMGEAVVFFNKQLSANAKYFRKQGAQLFSKMRFVSAQFLAYFENGLWKKNALHANNMAAFLAQEVEKLGIKITQKVEANGVFAILDDDIRDQLQKAYFFYPWDENNHEVRWMTSFDTREEDIVLFCKKLEELLNG